MTTYTAEQALQDDPYSVNDVQAYDRTLAEHASRMSDRLSLARAWSLGAACARAETSALVSSSSGGLMAQPSAAACLAEAFGYQDDKGDIYLQQDQGMAEAEIAFLPHETVADSEALADAMDAVAASLREECNENPLGFVAFVDKRREALIASRQKRRGSTL